MWKRQAARETEDQHDGMREPQKVAVLENTCPGYNSLRGNMKEALSLKVGTTFMFIYCHSCLAVALDQQRDYIIQLKCHNGMRHTLN